MPNKNLDFGILIKDPSTAEVSDVYFDKYEKFSQDEEVLENFLLGDFVEGKYTISTAIKYELVRKKKFVSTWFDNGLKAAAVIKNISFEFQIEISDFSDTEKIAYLFLIENIFGKKTKIFIADYLDQKTEFFRDKAMKVFNVEMENDFDEKDDFENIYARLLLLEQKNNKERRFVVETYSETYVVKMLKFLATCGQLGQKILKEYEEELKANGYDGKVTPELYIKLRRILNKAIKQNGGMSELAKIDPKVKNILKGYVDPIEYYDKVVGKTGFLEVNLPQKQNDKKTAAKATVSSDGASKSASAKKPASKGDAKGKSKDAEKDKKKDSKKKPILGNYLPNQKQPIKQNPVQVGKVNLNINTPPKPTVNPAKPQPVQQPQSPQPPKIDLSVLNEAFNQANIEKDNPLKNMNNILNKANQQEVEKNIEEMNSSINSQEEKWKGEHPQPLDKVEVIEVQTQGEKNIEDNIYEIDYTDDTVDVDYNFDYSTSKSSHEDNDMTK